MILVDFLANNIYKTVFLQVYNTVSFSIINKMRFWEFSPINCSRMIQSLRTFFMYYKKRNPNQFLFFQYRK